MNPHSGPGRRSFRPARVLAVLAITALLVGGAALPAQADELTVGNEVDLAAALAASSTTRVTLGADFTVARSKLTVAAPAVVLDLNGHVLNTDTVDLQPGVSLTITGGANGAGTLNAFGRGSSTAGLPAIATADATLIVTSGTINANAYVSSSNYSAAIGGYGVSGSTRGDGGTVIINGGRVTATSAYGSAIGSAIYSTSVGSIQINGGVVTAWSRTTHGSGLGGTFQGKDGSVTITGGTVTATSSTSGAAIGGGTDSATSTNTVSITGGTVVATGGANAAAIGGGTNHPGSNVTIGSGAVVTVNTVAAASQAFGAAAAYPAGSLSIAGTVTTSGPGRFMGTANGTLAGTATITPTGVVTGTNPLTGTGTVVNNGAIRNPSVTGLTVTNHNYPVTFQPNDSAAFPAAPSTPQVVTVYASSFAAGNRAIPVVSRDGYYFNNWNSAANGSGGVFTTSTQLAAASTQYAYWGPSTLTMSPDVATPTAGDTVVFTAEGLAGPTTSDATATTTFRSDNPTDVVTGNSIRFTKSGTRTITATNGTLTDTSAVTVGSAVLHSLTVTPANPTVTAGTSQVFVVDGFDEFLNPVDATAATVASSDDSDAVSVDRRSIRFSRSGDRTVTATLGAISGSTKVTTVPGSIASMTLDPANYEYSAGGGTSVVALGFDGEGNALGDVTAGTTFTTDVDPDSSVAADTVDGADITFYRSGARTITATNAGVTASVDVSVYAVMLDRIELDPAASTVAAGDSIAFSIREFDEFGNSLDYPSDIVLSTGDRARDAVDGMTVRFSAAGTATVTATATSSVSPAVTATADATVEIVPGEVASVVIHARDRAVAGTATVLSVEGFDAEGNSVGDVSSDATITSDVASDVIEGTTVSATAAGSRTLTALVAVRTPAAQVRTLAYAAVGVAGVPGTFELLVVADAANPASLTITFDGPLSAGSTVAATVRSFDRFGNLIADVTDGAVLTTNDPADVVRGSSITFASGGVHVVSARVGALNASQSAVVSALPPIPAAAVAAVASVLASTGANAVPIAGTAVVLLLLGLGMLLMRRRRATA